MRTRLEATAAAIFACAAIIGDYAERILEVEILVWRNAFQEVARVLRPLPERLFVSTSNQHARGAVRSIMRDPEFRHPTERLDAQDAVFEEANRVIEEMRESHLDEESYQSRIQVANKVFDLWAIIGGSAVAAIALLCVGIMVYDYLTGWWRKGTGLPQNWVRASHNWHSLAVSEKLLVVAGVLCIPTLLFLLIRKVRQAIRGNMSDHEEFVEKLLRPRIRLFLNDLSNSETPGRLQVYIAPGLGDTEIAERLIERPETERIRILNEELGAHSIAVSGPRGVGKTTLLKAVSPVLPGAGADLRVLVAAPVTYDAREFLLHLYIELCKHVLTLAGKPSRAVVQILINALRKLLRIATFIAGTLLLLTAMLPDLRQWLESRGLAIPASQISLLVIPTLVLVWLLSNRLRSGFVSKSTSSIVSRSKEQIQVLKFLQTITTEYSGAMKKTGFEFSRKRSRQLAMRPYTLPELVASYRNFVGEVVNWLRAWNDDAHLLICIDEVDRIAKAEDAERFLNDIKAIFGIRNCNYLVTVSEDALAGFERRVVRLRPALDSAFDEVIRLEPFTFEQSRRLVQQSVIGIPDAFVMLCHCVAGGIPRDLIRAVRTTLDQRRRFDASDIRSISNAVVASEVASLRRGLLARIAGGNAKVGAEILSALTETPNEATLDLETVVFVLAAQIEQEDARQNSQELGAALYYYYTVQEILTEKREELLRRPSLADDLAAIRAILPISASLTSTRLDYFREQLGLRSVAAPVAVRNLGRDS